MLVSSNIFSWIEKVIIFLAHIALLYWILFALQNGGSFTTKTLLMHFVGMGVYGALLIRISAYLANRRYQKELKK